MRGLFKPKSPDQKKYGTLANLPETRVARAAIRVSEDFSEKRFHELFDCSTLGPGRTIGSSLASWYVLAYLCFLVSMSVLPEILDEPKDRLTSLLDGGYEQLLYQWKMNEPMVSLFKEKLREALPSMLSSYNASLVSPEEYRRFFRQSIARILGLPQPEVDSITSTAVAMQFGEAVERSRMMLLPQR
ncbi:MAG TPA: hypothetical protein VGM11_15660 [Acidobacteriaceae bacterium]|jgi:hypothetical protein